LKKDSLFTISVWVVLISWRLINIAAVPLKLVEIFINITYKFTYDALSG